MAEKKTAIKSGLLLSPAKLIENRELLRLIHVKKSEKGVQFDITYLDEVTLRKHCLKLPGQAHTALYQLTSHGLNMLEDAITRKHKQQQSGVPLRQFLRSAYYKAVAGAL